MDSDNQPRYQTVFGREPSSDHRHDRNGHATPLDLPDPATPPPLPDSSNPSAILDYLRSGHLLIVNGRRKMV
ncbi:MAG: hypothetical protein HC881_02480 [Leptolyngbyaceae cyanobacterium SL_7_1]|nr:hypothetical protein [Leptolyngbyaceae cyanobacterium SL_7_1]